MPSWPAHPLHFDHRATSGGPPQVLLRDAYLDPAHLEPLENRFGGRRGQGLEQPEALAFHDLAHRPIKVIVVHRVREPVTRFRPGVERVELQVHFQALPRLLLVGPRPVMPEYRQTLETNG